MKKDNERPPTNTRKFRQESDRKYLYLVIFTLVVVGGFLIALVYGTGNPAYGPTLPRGRSSYDLNPLAGISWFAKVAGWNGRQR